MGKRVLISILLVVVIIGSIAAGAALFFQGRYNNLAEEQAKPPARTFPIWPQQPVPHWSSSPLPETVP